MNESEKDSHNKILPKKKGDLKALYAIDEIIIAISYFSLVMVVLAIIIVGIFDIENLL